MTLVFVDRGGKLDGRLAIPVERAQQAAEIAMHQGVIGVELDGLRIFRHGAVGIATKLQSDAHIVMADRVARVDLERNDVLLPGGFAVPLLGVDEGYAAMRCGQVGIERQRLGEGGSGGEEIATVVEDAALESVQPRHVLVGLRAMLDHRIGQRQRTHRIGAAHAGGGEIGLDVLEDFGRGRGEQIVRLLQVAGAAGIDFMAVEPQPQPELFAEARELAGDRAAARAAQQRTQRGLDGVQRNADARHHDVRQFALQRDLGILHRGVHGRGKFVDGVAQPLAGNFRRVAALLQFARHRQRLDHRDMRGESLDQNGNDGDDGDRHRQLDDQRIEIVAEESGAAGDQRSAVGLQPCPALRPMRRCRRFDVRIASRPFRDLVEHRRTLAAAS